MKLCAKCSSNIGVRGDTRLRLCRGCMVSFNSFLCEEKIKKQNWFYVLIRMEEDIEAQMDYTFSKLRHSTIYGKNNIYRELDNLVRDIKQIRKKLYEMNVLSHITKRNMTVEVERIIRERIGIWEDTAKL